MTQTAPAEAGKMIDGKYIVKGMLGKGGMGSVYEAEHAATGRRCAVKVINTPEMTKDPQVVSRFQREARAAGSIDTQYITQVLDAGVDRETGFPFLAMEFMEGEDLQHMLKRVGPISPELALRVVAQACLGLQKAHDQGVVHRDIKPHNLYLARRDAGEVVIKLLDFGIAKVKMEHANSTEGADLTKTGNLLGSPLYVSPEQARGKRQIDHRTDIYSLGAVLYQMLCGKTPYHHATALGDLILMVCTEPAPPIQDLAPWVPPEIAEICHRCLLKDPAARYQGGKELFEACRALLGNGWGIHEDMLVSLEDSQRSHEAQRLSSDNLLAASHSGAIGAITGGASTTGPLVHSQTGGAQSSKPKWPAVVAMLAVVGMVAAVGVALTQSNKSQPNTPPPQAAQPAPAPEPKPEPKPAPEVKKAAPKPKRVQVVILPGDAKVTVEGKPVTLRNGMLELVGIQGSVHRVTVKKLGGETTEDVVITERGALPLKIEVKAGVKKQHLRKAGGALKKKAEPSKPAPAPRIPVGVKKETSEFD